MPARITEAMISRTVLRDLNIADRRLSETQRKLSSGKELTRPSDDPFAVGRALRLRSERQRHQQKQREEADHFASVRKVME